jgi:hypothetical protein
MIEELYLTHKKHLKGLLLLFCFILFASSAMASHFRYGDISFRFQMNDANKSYHFLDYEEDFLLEYYLLPQSLKDLISTNEKFNARRNSSQDKTLIQFLDFADYIAMAEQDQQIINYFNAISNDYVKLTSMDKLSLNEFLKTNKNVFGKTLINGDEEINNYTKVDFNVMFSTSSIELVLKKISNGIVTEERIININY